VLSHLAAMRVALIGLILGALLLRQRGERRAAQ
jgi:hypothetical protein